MYEIVKRVVSTVGRKCDYVNGAEALRQQWLQVGQVALNGSHGAKVVQSYLVDWGWEKRVPV